MNLIFTSSFGYKGGYISSIIKRKIKEITGKEQPVYCYVSFYKGLWRESADISGFEYWFREQAVLYPAFATKEDFETAMEECDVLTLPGGNTFQYASIMQNVGMYDFVRKFANSPGKVVVGTSAGSIIMGKTILSAQWADPMKPYLDDLRTFDGVGLANFAIKPHAESYFPEYNNVFQKFCNEKRLSMHCVGEDSALVVIDGKMEKIGFVKTMNPGDPFIVIPKEKEHRHHRKFLWP